MKMTENELAEFDKENEELMELFNRRQPTMDTVARMFPKLTADPIIDDMELSPMPTKKIDLNGESAFVGAIWLSVVMILLIVIFGML